MKFQTLAEGFVSRREPGTPTSVAATSRCAVTNAGDIVCTFLAQSKLGINDFKPMLARSRDGIAWSEPRLMWPHLQDAYSISGSISRAPNGDLFYYGTRYKIDVPGESFWSDATQGLKESDLIWSRSIDNGETWLDPVTFPMPIPGAAEAPGAMTITHGSRWICCYAPYNTFDPSLVVDRNQVVAMYSDDQGATWRHNSMIRFTSIHSTAAEAWVIELADGRLLGTTWHMNQADQSDHPNAYALSLDSGTSWLPTGSTGIMGQSTALAPLPDGRALFIYNQRKYGEPGVWLALANPTENDFGVEANKVVWRAQTTTQSNSSDNHDNWEDFSFGEPSITVLPDGCLLVTLWCVQPDGQGIRFVKLRMQD